jgi:peptide/nickel transport system substrate-binding protein
MPSGNTGSRLNRRHVLKALGTGGAVAVAGCSAANEQEGTETGGQGGGETTSAGTTESGEKRVGGTFVVAQTSDGRSMSPYGFDDEATSDRLYRIFDGGYSITEEIAPEPRFFATWELSDSADVVEYELQDNLQYGAGYGQLTAEDYIYNYENVWSPSVENWTGFSYQTEFVLGGEEVTLEKTGTLSMRMELPQPRSNWLHADPMGYVIPAPKDLLQPYAEAKDYEGFKKDDEITSVAYSGNLGPYAFESWDRSSKMVLSRNDDYYLREKLEEYADVPYYDSVEFQVFDEKSTALSALTSGDVNYANLDERKAGQFESNPDTTVWSSEYGEALFYVNINHRKNGWDQLRKKGVRQALAHAIEKQAVIQQVLNGHAYPLDTFHPRWGPYYDDSSVVTFPLDLEQARSTLESSTDSGYTYDGDTFVDPDGEQVELSMITVSGSKTGEITAQYIQSQLNKIGLGVNIDSTAWGNLLSNYAQNSVTNTEGVSEADWSVGAFNGGPWDQSTSKNDWDIMYGLGFSHGAYDPWGVTKTLFTERGSFNMIGYTPDADLASLVNDAATSTSKQEATEYMAEVFGVLSEEQPLIFMMGEHVLDGYTADVGGLPEPENAFTSQFPTTLSETYFTE